MAPVLASLLILAGLGIFARVMLLRIRPLLFARKEVRWDDPAQRTEKLLLYGFVQKRMPPSPSGERARPTSGSSPPSSSRNSER